jgi:hypothetical protein
MATGPGDELEAAGRGHLRASHADRERVIGTLKAAFVQGMLTNDELDLRVGQTLASRTYADLAALTADIPTRLTGPPAAEPGRDPRTQKRRQSWRLPARPPRSRACCSHCRRYRKGRLLPYWSSRSSAYGA